MFHSGHVLILPNGISFSLLCMVISPPQGGTQWMERSCWNTWCCFSQRNYKHHNVNKVYNLDLQTLKGKLQSCFRYFQLEFNLNPLKGTHLPNNSKLKSHQIKEMCLQPHYIYCVISIQLSIFRIIHAVIGRDHQPSCISHSLTVI